MPGYLLYKPALPASQKKFHPGYLSPMPCIVFPCSCPFQLLQELHKNSVKLVC